jgi:CubicO group peptidase (beta-lactamase class C family)
MVAGIGLLTVARSQSQSTDAVDTPAPLAAPAPTTAKPATTETAAPATPSPIAPIPAVQLEAFVDGLVAEARTRDHIAGVAVTVVQNGQVVLRKGYGFAGPGRAVDPERTLFRLGGITSTFTWIALMKEAEAGHIRLDAPANLVLPEKLRIHDQGFHRQVLMRDLMNHSAGFEDRTLGQLFERDPGNVRPLDDYLLQERPRRVREPGDLPSYSYYGAALAGAALSYFDTRPYQTVIESEILKPLGLSHTSLREPYPARADLPAPMASALSSEVSVGYLWRGGEFQPQGFEFSTQLAPAWPARRASTAGTTVSRNSPCPAAIAVRDSWATPSGSIPASSPCRR